MAAKRITKKKSIKNNNYYIVNCSKTLQELVH